MFFAFWATILVEVPFSALHKTLLGKKAKEIKSELIKEKTEKSS
jgi:hypothetical protein